ncbi:hypothetical protein ACOSP6_01625 [Tenacibaculum sp. MEBiC06402]|uniref:hypothetical protein n=1 Tax=unclassified Tenacibaculum TaxID=2635139 RepID=UPI003B9CA8F6
MKYIIWDEDDTPLSAEVQIQDKEYFKRYVIPNLKPITENDYIEAFSVILHTAARSAYILFDEKCFWLIEWEPGLIILEFQKEEVINFTALRSPIPNFGGREPLEIDIVLEEEEDIDNHQYNLIFNAWDAQFDKQHREWYNFKSASQNELKLFNDCLLYADKLGDFTQSKFENNYENYLKTGKKKIQSLAGTGILTK